MSHIVEIRTQVRDPVAVGAACRRLELPPPRQGRATLFSGDVTGLIVTLPDWKYPVVFDLPSGQARFDNYGGRWGEQRHLDRFLQAYAVEKATSAARCRGYTVSEQPLADGSIRLTMQGGAHA